MADPAPLERELAGLPELEALPTREQRDAALRSIAASLKNPRDWRSWLWGAILVVAVIPAMAGVIGGFRWVGAPGPLATGMGVAAGLVVNPFLSRAVVRRAARPALRDELEKTRVATLRS